MIMLKKQNNFILLRIYIASIEGIWEGFYTFSYMWNLT